MSKLMLKLWNDDHGFVMHVELLFILTILVIGTVTALVALRQAVIAESVEIANAILALNNSFSFSGQSNCESSSAGSAALQESVGGLHEGSVAPALVATITQSPCD
jgi:hypothetical protein